MTRVLLAVDGGNSKTDVVLLASDGSLLAAVHGRTVSHQVVGLEAGARELARLVGAARAAGGLGPGSADLGVLCLAGVDSRADVRALAAAHGASGLARELVFHNDTLAAFRAGSPGPWGVAVIVGAGINAVGVAPSGREVRFAALGAISGDRGGGGWLGIEALGSAVRAREGRGPRTVLERTVPAVFGLDRPIEVTMALYGGRLAEHRLMELAPVVLEAARGGDAVALGLVDALADEVAGFAVAAIRRAGIARRAVPVVLGGGVARGAGALLAGRVAMRVRAVAPRAVVTILRDPPVVGAALLALDRASPGDQHAAARGRAAVAAAVLDDATVVAANAAVGGADAT